MSNKMMNNRNNNEYNYINDNLARNYYYQSAAPKIDKPRINEPKIDEPRINEPVRRQNQNPKKQERGLASSFGFAFAALMVACSVVLFMSLTKYITLNIEINQKEKLVANLRKQVTTATMENDNYEMAINASIDYNYIYNVATKELGMVYASANQIVNYDHENGEYVIQYKDVE